MLIKPNNKKAVLELSRTAFFILINYNYYSAFSILGGVLKSMLASDIAIIDIEEYQIKHLKVVIKLL